MRTNPALLAVGAVLGLGLFGVTVAVTTVALTSGDDAAIVAAPPAPSPSPSPSPPPSKTPLPSPPAVGQGADVLAKPSPSQPRIQGFSPRFVFDDVGCAEVPKRVLDEVNKHLPSEFRARLGAASQWRGDSAVFTAHTERLADNAVINLDFYINTRGTLFDYNSGDVLLTDLPEYPSELDDGNAVSMGLASCVERISGDVLFE